MVLEQGKKGPENPIKRGPKPPETPGAIPSIPVDAETGRVLGQFDEKAKKYAERMKEIFEKRISRPGLGEIAIREVGQMEQGQKQAISKLFEKYKMEFQQLAATRKGDRDKLANELFDRADREATALVEQVEAVMQSLVKGNFITENEIVDLRKRLVGIEKIASEPNGKKLGELLIKLNNNGEPSESDYADIIKILNPRDITKKDAKPQENFEATTCGLLIALMKPDQRFKLVQKLMDFPRHMETGSVIDGFMRNGILNGMQGEALFLQAFQKGIISRQEYEDYQTKIKDGTYQKEAKKIQDEINTQVQRLKGMYNENLMNRVVGAPMLGLGMLLHSIFWLITNILASGGNFKEIANNPYVYAAIGEGALGLEVASGSMKKGTETLGIGAGKVTGWIERMGKKDAPKNDTEKRAYDMLADIYLNYPDFGHYLEKGGAEAILDLRKEKEGKGKKGLELHITLQELIKKEEKNKSQQQLLSNAARRYSQETEKQINAVGEICFILSIKKQDEFNRKLGIIKDSQGLGQRSASTQPGLKRTVG